MKMALSSSETVSPIAIIKRCVLELPFELLEVFCPLHEVNIVRMFENISIINFIVCLLNVCSVLYNTCNQSIIIDGISFE